MKTIMIYAGIGLALVAMNLAGIYMIVGGINKEHPAVESKSSTASTDEAPSEGSAGAHEKASTEATPGVKKEAIYFPIFPAFVANVITDGDKPKFMQADVTVMAHDQADIDAFQLHMPAIRNALIMLFAGSRYDELSTADGKEKLRLASLATIRSSMEKAYGKPAIEDVYFTRLVIQ